MTYEMDVAGLKRELPICRVTDDLYIGAFIMFGDAEITVACARELLARAPKDYDYLLTAEAKSIPLIHEMARQSGATKYFIARKGPKVYMPDPISVADQSITTLAQQMLYLGSDDAALIKGKKIVIMDDVISTGGSLKAMEALVHKAGGEVVGNHVRAKVVKNKVAPPFMKAEFDIMFGEGISKSGEILDMAVEHGIIKKSGAWFSYENAKLGQGRDAVKRVIADNAELADELADKIRAKLKQERDEKHGTTGAPFNPYLPSKDNQRVEDEVPADEGLPIEDDPYDEDFSVEIED